MLRRALNWLLTKLGFHKSVSLPAAVTITVTPE